MKKLLPLLFFLIVSFSSEAQTFPAKKIENDPFFFDSFLLLQDGKKSFIISKYKTTNREYLCFLQWTYRVYSIDYPETYKEMLPDTVTYPDIFNPEKLNMPVKGITKKQAQAFCQWRSDRLNEYILIRDGILNKNFHQLNEKTFNSESYLSGLYNEEVKNDIFDRDTQIPRQIIHLDFYLLPCFYIASIEEIESCDALIKSTNFEIKKSIKSDLDWWFSTELRLILKKADGSPFNIFKSKLPAFALSDKTKIHGYLKKCKIEMAHKTIDFKTTDVMFSDVDYRLLNLYKYKSKMRYYKPLSDSLPNPFRKMFPLIDKKDKLGKMDFVYIADNFDGTPICINKSVFEDNRSDDISKIGFYCAMNIPYRLYFKLLKYPFSENTAKDL